MTEPRSAIGTFTTLFALTALPFGIAMGLLTGLPKDEAAISGFLFGIAFGAAMTPFVKGLSIQRHVTDEVSFCSQLRFVMAQLNYEQTGYVGDLYHFDPTGLSGVSVAGVSLSPKALNRVIVRVQPSYATILGPRWIVRKLESRSEAYRCPCATPRASRTLRRAGPTPDGRPNAQSGVVQGVRVMGSAGLEPATSCL